MSAIHTSLEAHAADLLSGNSPEFTYFKEWMTTYGRTTAAYRADNSRVTLSNAVARSLGSANTDHYCIKLLVNLKPRVLSSIGWRDALDTGHKFELHANLLYKKDLLEYATVLQAPPKYLAAIKKIKVRESSDVVDFSSLDSKIFKVTTTTTRSCSLEEPWEITVDDVTLTCQVRVRSGDGFRYSMEVTGDVSGQADKVLEYVRKVHPLVRGSITLADAQERSRY